MIALLKTEIAKSKTRGCLLFGISLVLVALGQPARFSCCGVLSSFCGFALVFQSLLYMRRPFLWGTLWFAAVQAIQLSWMTTIQFQGYYILAVYLVLTLLCGVQFGALCIQIPRSGLLSWRCVLYGSAFWTLMEWLRLFVFCGFSWNPIGLALSCSEWGLQGAAMGGVFGLSFWVMFCNLLCVNVLRRRALSLYFVLAACAPYLFGILHLAFQDARLEARCLRVALVQTDFLPSEKLPLFGRNSEFIPPLEQWRRIVALFKRKERVSWDLIALPEATTCLSADTPFYPLQEVKRCFVERFDLDSTAFFPPLQEPYAQITSQGVLVTNLFWAQALANYFEADVIAGFYRVDRATQRYFNSAFYCQPHESAVDQYDKQILLPLAEYLPFSVLKVLTKYYGITHFFTPGKGPSLWGKHVLAPCICYEETFPGLMRLARLQGAQLFVNMTNDNYYPQSSLHKQHLYHARLRAVENGIPLIRACNAGGSAAVDSLGRIIEVATLTGSSRAMITECEVNAAMHPTFFLIWGNLGVLVLSISLCGWEIGKAIQMKYLKISR